MFRRPSGLHRGSGRAAAVALAVTAALTAGLGGTAAAAPAPGARVVSAVQRGASEIDLQVFSPAMNATLPVTLLLPRNYANGGSFPTLYALSGMDEVDDKAWTKLTDLPAFAAVHDALVVLPPTSKGGMFSDWFAPGPRWETFDTVELPALIRSQFKGTGRQAVMGISMGGHAALKFAEHQPGAWAAAASFSGIPFSSAPGISALYEKSMSDVGVNPTAPWGDPVAQSNIWAAQDPATHVENLRGTAVFVSASGGVPAPTGAGDPGVGQVLQNPPAALSGAAQGSGLESAAFTTSVLFAQKAAAAGVPVTADFPPTGVHNWPLWNDEYKKAWPTIAAALGIPRLTTSAAFAGAPTVQFAALRPDVPGDDDPTGWRAAAVIATASAGAGLVVVDATVVNLAAPALVADLGIGGGGAQWVVEAYTVVFASLLLSAGRLGDRFGRRRCLAAGALLLAGAGALAAVTPGPAVLLLARALQGAGAALVFPATLSVLGATFRGPGRGTAFALWGSTIAATAGIGALLGGWLTTTLGWRAVFAAFVPVGVAIAVAARLTLPESREPTGSVDAAGALLSAAGVGAGVLALVQGPVWGWWVPEAAAPSGWPVSPVPLLVVAAVLCAAAFAVRQRGLSAAGAVPLLSPRLLRIRSFRAGTGAAAVIHFGEFGLMFVLPFWWQDVLGWTAAQAAVLLVFPAVAALAGGLITSVLVRRVGPRTTVRAGLACEGAAAAGLALLVSTGAAPFALGAALLAVYGVGLGLASAQLGSIVLADLSGDDVGAGSGAMTTAQQVGAAFGVAVLGAVTFSAPVLAHGVARALALTAVALVIALAVTWRLGAVPGRPAGGRHRR